jgi:hypothetical protein
MAAKFKTALPAAGSGHGRAWLGEKQERYGGSPDRNLFHKIIIQ